MPVSAIAQKQPVMPVASSPWAARTSDLTRPPDPVDAANSGQQTARQGNRSGRWQATAAGTSKRWTVDADDDIAPATAGRTPGRDAAGIALPGGCGIWRSTEVGPPRARMSSRLSAKAPS